jgi:hypothetical protein
MPNLALGHFVSGWVTEDNRPHAISLAIEIEYQRYHGECIEVPSNNFHASVNRQERLGHNCDSSGQNAST